MSSIDKKLKAGEILELVFRMYVFTFLTIYASGKLLGGQFYTPDSIPDEVFTTDLGVASNYELAWTFMGRSYGYILFIGISQLIGATLLLFNRTKLIGVAILMPILLNIIVFDIFFLDKYGALASACIYFAMLVGILLFNKSKVLLAVKPLITYPHGEQKSIRRFLFKIVISLAVFAFIFLFDQWLVNILGH